MRDLRDRQRSEQPLSAANPGNSAGDEKLIKEDRRVTTNDSAKLQEINHESAANTVRQLSQSVFDPSTVGINR